MWSFLAEAEQRMKENSDIYGWLLYSAEFLIFATFRRGLKTNILLFSLIYKRCGIIINIFQKPKFSVSHFARSVIKSEATMSACLRHAQTKTSKLIVNAVGRIVTIMEIRGFTASYKLKCQSGYTSKPCSNKLMAAHNMVIRNGRNPLSFWKCFPINIRSSLPNRSMRVLID